MNEEVNTLQGHVHAMNLVLTQLILQMTPVQAARAAAGLAVEHFGSQEYDEASPSNPGEIQARTALTETYLAVLEAVSQRA